MVEGPKDRGPAVSIEKQLRDLRELLEIAKALSVEKNFDALIDLIVDAANRVMEAERGSLYIYDGDTDELWTKIAHGAERFRIKVGQGIAGTVAAERKVINMTDADTDPRHFKGIDKKSGFHTKTMLTGPLVNHEGKLIGVLQLLNKRVEPFYFTPYDEELLAAFGSHIALTLDQARLVDEYVAKQKMQHDLDLAREIQVGLLPKETPEVEGFDIFGWSEACDETGGDYFDYIPMGDGRLGLVIADVTGHGIGPALLMAEARAFVRSAASFGGNVDCVLCKVNELLAADLTGGRFVTLFWGMLDTSDGALEYSSAGHGHVVVYHASDATLEELESTAPPLGIIKGLEFPVGTARNLEPGDVLLMTTDGIEEAMNPASEEFGRERLRDVLKANASKMSCDIAQAIRDDVLAFMSGAQQRDDLTMVVVKAL